MKQNILRFALLLMVIGSVGCDRNRGGGVEEDESPQSYSSFVRDVFNNESNSEAVSTIEDEDFQFEDADELETYIDLLGS